MRSSDKGVSKIKIAGSRKEEKEETGELYKQGTTVNER